VLTHAHYPRPAIFLPLVARLSDIEKLAAAGLQAYYLKQVSGDSGPGATLGSFKGEAIGVGATAAYHFPIGRMPATVRLRGLWDLDVTNRPESKSLWLELAVPLQMTLPPSAADN
jgi:hypothetical protein